MLPFKPGSPQTEFSFETPEHLVVMRAPQLVSVSKNEERRATVGRGGARQTSFSPTARACCEDGCWGSPPPGSLQGRTRCYQNTIHYGSDSSSWDPALLDLRGISVLAREKKGMWKRKALGRMKERRGDSSRPDAEGGREAKTRRREWNGEPRFWDALQS